MKRKSTLQQRQAAMKAAAQSCFCGSTGHNSAEHKRRMRAGHQWQNELLKKRTAELRAKWYPE